jgi:hypothetical protein
MYSEIHLATLLIVLNFQKLSAPLLLLTCASQKTKTRKYILQAHVINK